jgi:glycosyltransferase involved in cell wall biosynthesis
VTARRLGILYVGTLPPHQGGSAIQGAHVLVGLARLGHRVRAVAQMRPSDLRDGDHFARQHPELDVVRMTVPYFHVYTETAPDDAFRDHEGRQIEELVRSSLAAERPDVIVLGRELFAWHLPRLGASAEIPRVLLAQGATAWLANGNFPRDVASTLVERIRTVDRVVTAAEHMRALLGTLGVDRVDVVANAVDLSLFRPAGRDPDLVRELSVGEDDVVVLHASNLKPIKRPFDLVESAAIALEQEPRLLYVVVGDGPMRQAVEEAVLARGLTHRFRFAGWVDHGRMPTYLNLADVVAMPSEAESQALVYLEAMACGGTLLASDIPGAREVADDGDHAVMFPVGDVRALAAKTVALARDAELRRAIGLRARERVRRHGRERIAGEYERVLHDVVGRAGEQASP